MVSGTPGHVVLFDPDLFVDQDRRIPDYIRAHLRELFNLPDPHADKEGVPPVGSVEVRRAGAVLARRRPSAPTVSSRVVP